MKNIIIFKLLLVFAFVLNSCTQEYQDIVTENAAAGGLVEVQTPLLNYVIGEDQDYTVGLKVFQGDIKTQTINVLKTFVTRDDDGNTVTSNEVLLQSYDIAEAATSLFDFTVNFETLRSGLQVNGADLPDDDALYNIGDFWELTFQAVTSEGNLHRNLKTTKIAVSTRLAGLYNITQGHYYHPSTVPDLAADYSGDYLRIVESVDAETYRMVEIGPWSNEGNLFYFVVNQDNSITIPKEYGGATQLIWGADELANCDNDPGELANVSCVNTVELMDDGKDVISISYGYIRSSGTRQFDDILTKN